MESSPPDSAFTQALPKPELHAHFSGSISKQTLHKIWLQRRQWEALDLDDPLTAIKSGEHGYVDIETFFPLFDNYIYTLIDNLDSVLLAFQQVLQDFAEDGVSYLELRTTPRAVGGGNSDGYVKILNLGLAMRARQRACQRPQDVEAMEVYLILSIDRDMSAEQAMEVVDLAIYYKHQGLNSETDDCYVVGIDLCGNPAKGDVAIFTPAFRKAKEHELGITVHFAEIPQSASDGELETILSWQPDRLGHCVHVASKFKDVVAEHGIALELCLSCNVLASLTEGGFDKHHFREWHNRNTNPVALGTDDVGIFGSSLSNEYMLASKHFGLSKQQIVDLSRRACDAVFAGEDAKKRMKRRLDAFAEEQAVV